MSRRCAGCVGVLVTLSILAAGPATGAVVEQSVAELTAAAQQIVVGDVVDLTSFWDDEHALIKSRITVQVSQYLLGSGSGTEELEMSGGTVGDVSLAVTALPVFQMGDHVLLFLDHSATRLVGAHQGAFLTDGEQTAQMGPACTRTIGSTRQPLTALLEQVEQALPAGQTLPELLPYTGGFELPATPRYGLCGYSWVYQANPMGENYLINANCVDSAAGDANAQRVQLQNGVAAWNSAGADFQFTYGGTTTLSSVTYNNTNIVFFSTSPPDGGSYVAATYIWYSGSNITEIDLVFNDRDYTWWNGSGSCGSNKMDIWNVAAHEFGHWLCLEDLYNGSDSAKTMYGYVSYCDIHARTLDADDINGIIAIYGSAPAPDTTPPTPNPMTFASAPAPTSTSAISMTATTATDANSPPVQYYFNFVSGGTGGNDSAWQAGTAYSDGGLAANTSYTYRVKARDSASTPNETTYSGNSSTATYIETPTGISFGTTTINSIVLNATGTLTNLTVGSSGVYFDSTTSGGDTGINAWITTTTDTATSLAANTLYTFQVKARNQNSVETAYSGSASQPTLIQTPTGVTFGTVTSNSIDLVASGTLTNLTVGSSGVYFDSTTSGGDGGINAWVQTTTDSATGLQPNTLYTFQAKARNQNAVETAYSAAASKTTLANVPAAPTLGSVGAYSLSLDVNVNGNPASTAFAIQCVATTDTTWNGKYVDATGNPSAAAVWQTDATWGTIALVGLDPNTQYCFAVKARNGELVETALSSQSCVTTANSLPGDTNCDGIISYGDINPFVVALTGQSAYEAAYPGCPWLNADVNGDGTVTYGDINPFVELLAGP